MSTPRIASGALAFWGGGVPREFSRVENCTSPSPVDAPWFSPKIVATHAEEIVHGKRQVAQFHDRGRLDPGDDAGDRRIKACRSKRRRRSDRRHRISDKDDPKVAMKLSEFLASAWKLANDKARELGWIA